MTQKERFGKLFTENKLIMMRLILICAMLIPSVMMAQTKAKVVTKTPAGKTKTSTSSTTAGSTSKEKGKTIYQTYCLVCHQADGGGVPRMNPPFVKEWVGGDKSRLVRLLLKGSNGKVEIDGDKFSNTMPPQPTFTDQQIADVLTFVRSSFGFKASAITATEVKTIRAKTK
jgi:mono/diheme cytochrome c family protein